MAFGYKVPNFNLWARIWQVRCNTGDAEDRYYLPPKYTRCAIAKDINLFSMHILFPKHTALRDNDQTPLFLGDLIQVAGWENMVASIQSVRDIGAGFFNEHRAAYVYWWIDASPGSPYGQLCGSVNPDLEPPDGAEMVGLVEPADFWEEPQIVGEHPPP